MVLLLDDCKAGGDVDYRYIAKELLNEHPQTIAVALSRLPSEQSSQILKLLPSFIQADLVNRIVETDQIPYMVLEEVDRMLVRIMK
jgi:flagellar motor switch protein FliG